jgi:hypothetical protein
MNASQNFLLFGSVTHKYLTATPYIKTCKWHSYMNYADVLKLVHGGRCKSAVCQIIAPTGRLQY